MSVALEHDQRRASTVLPVTLIVVQLYVFAAYLIGAILPYAFRDVKPPLLLVYVFGFAFGVAGFWVAALGALLVGVVALAAAASFLAQRRHLSPKLASWLAVTTAASIALTAWMLTPLGEAVRNYVLD